MGRIWHRVDSAGRDLAPLAPKGSGLGRAFAGREPHGFSAVCAALAAFAALLVHAEAHAYCRTTTVALASSVDDPSVSGVCWSQGTDLAWPGGQSVGYSLDSAASTQVTFAEATRIADLAFNSWNQAPCPKGPISVQAYDKGPVSPALVATDCGLVTCGPTVHDTLHAIVFRDSGWTHNDPNNTIALTTVTFGAESGTIFDADIEINSSKFTISTAEPPPSGSIDLQSILTHEAGHFFGLAHATEQGPIMYASYQPGTIELTPDDLAGICAIYPPVSSGGCSFTVAPWEADWPLASAGAFLCVLAWARRRPPQRRGRATSRQPG